MLVWLSVWTLEQGANLHMAQLMLLPLTVSCFSEIQIGFTFLVPAHLGSHGKRAVKRVCVCGTDDYVGGPYGCAEFGANPLMGGFWANG